MKCAQHWVTEMRELSELGFWLRGKGFIWSAEGLRFQSSSSRLSLQELWLVDTFGFGELVLCSVHEQGDMT